MLYADVSERRAETESWSTGSGRLVHISLQDLLSMLLYLYMRTSYDM